MKIKSCLSFLAWLALTPMALTAGPLGTSSSYQGRVTGNPLPTSVSVTFSLWDDSSSTGSSHALGNPHSITIPNIPVINGVFYTDKLDFGPLPFRGEESWLEVKIGNNPPTRSRVAPGFNSIYASTAGTVKDRAIGVSQLGVAGTPSSGQVLGYNGSSLVWQNPAAPSGGWALGGNSASSGNFLGTLNNLPLEMRVNNGRVLTLNPTDVQVSPGANLSFGNSTRQMLNLWGTQYGIGVQSLTTYFRCDNADVNNGFAWFRGGVHDGGLQNPGLGGQRLMSLTADGLVVTSGGVSAYGGTLAAISGYSAGGSLAGLFMGDVRITGDATVGVVRASSFTTEPFVASGALAGYELHDRATGVAGRWVMYAENGTLALWNAGANRMSISSAGHLTVPVLTITGGADVAEPFKMSGKDLPKGAVVVIDEANPGHLRLSESAYDTRVAGIISGANGVAPGISLSQQGVLEGDQNVALSGRVYVHADDSNGPINPGDLLTTSATPGHAMKVADHGKAQGAILGKAMTSLKEGQGMVLVLVSLQ